MNQWGKLLALAAAHPTLGAAQPSFINALQVYLQDFFPERVALVLDTTSCEPNAYFVLNRMLGALMLPLESDERRFCLTFLRKLYFLDFEALAKIWREEPNYLANSKDFSPAVCATLGFLGKIYQDCFLEQNLPQVFDFIEKNQDHLDESLLLEAMEQMSASMTFQGVGSQYLPRFQNIERRLFERLGSVTFTKKGQPKTFFFFISTVVWREEQISHAPTHILNQWLSLLRPHFDRFVVCYEEGFTTALPATSYYFDNCYLPDNTPENVEFVGLTKILPSDVLHKILCQLGMGYDTPMMILGGNQKVSTRLRLQNSYFYPMIQMPLLHSARVSFYFSVVGTSPLAQRNIFGEALEFIEASEGLAEKEAHAMILPQDYLRQFIPDLSAGALKIVMVGYQLISEMSANQAELQALFRQLAAKRPLEVYCIGLAPSEWEEMRWAPIPGGQFFALGAVPFLKQSLLELKPHFYLNPKRMGGGGGAYQALHLGIPVLSYPVGDVGTVMSLLYVMNEPADFAEFIESYLENADFRATINDVHRHFFARSFLSKSDCCRLLIRKIREIDASLSQG